MVKITKYTKEKRKQDSEKHRKEQSKHKYKTTQNMRYILSEIWKSQPFMLVVLLMCVVASVAELLFTSFTGKYVVELALGTSSRVHLAVICLLLIFGKRISRYIWNEASDYCGFYGNYGNAD